MKRRLLILSLISLLLLAVTFSSYATEIPWSAITGGGGHDISGIYTLESAIAQPVAGATTSQNAQLCAGYLCGVINNYNVYLPSAFK